jgi:hypothetical protein
VVHDRLWGVAYFIYLSGTLNGGDCHFSSYNRKMRCLLAAAHVYSSASLQSRKYLVRA